MRQQIENVPLDPDPGVGQGEDRQDQVSRYRVQGMLQLLQRSMRLVAQLFNVTDQVGLGFCEQR